MENPLAEHEAAQAALPYPAIRKIGINMRLSFEVIQNSIHERRYGSFLRRSHTVETPVPLQLLADFERFKAEWELLEKVGLARGFLRMEYDDDYDTSYMPYEVKEPQPHIETVYDETEQEFEARVDASYATYNATGVWVPGSEPVVGVRTLLDPWFHMVSEEVAEYRKNYKW